jgi:hypothetical protein
MGLSVPVTGVDPGPDWANQINNSLSLIDSHDHSSGKGVPITPAGMNISSDLNIQNHNLTSVKGLAFQSQSLNPASVNTLYCLSGNLYYNDINGVQIALTINGSIAGTSGSITNLVAPAAVVYGSGLFDFIQNVGVEGDLKFSSLVFKNNGGAPLPPTNGLVIKSPAVIPSPYSLTLPPAVAGSVGSFLTSDASGNLGYTTVDSATLQYSANIISVAPVGIQQSNLYKRSVSNTTASAGNVASIGYGGSGTFAAGSSITGAVTLVTTGRPVMIQLVGAPYNNVYGSLWFGTISIVIDGTITFTTQSPTSFTGANFAPTTSWLATIAAGSHTIDLKAGPTNGALAQGIGIIAYEI